MAWIDDLVSQVSDAQLRCNLEKAVTQLRDVIDFGLVFEHHAERDIVALASYREREREMILGTPIRQIRARQNTAKLTLSHSYAN